MKAYQSPSYLRWLMVAPTCALLAVSSLLAQPTPAATTESAASEEVVKMSPFQVQASSRDVGYYAENTLAGSRLNTNVGDLASSITVVTKQQLIDTASVDINDVFMYEANTEGSRTYTPQFLTSTRRGDPLAGWSSDTGDSGFGPSMANRVRGLDVSDIAVNNYPASNRIAMDAYNTNSIEISRGPNSLLFGTGSPAGITNQNTTSAVLNQRKTQVSYQLSSWGGYRASISHNQPLGSKLAVYLAGLYDSKGFQRKPSADIYRRQYAAITYQPFRGTRITASYEHYDNYNRRANSQTPLDSITPWLQAGRPAFNPVTQMVTIMDTGRVLGPYVGSTSDPRYASTLLPTYNLPAAFGNNANTNITTTTSPMYVSGIDFTRTHNYMLINQGTLLGMWQRWPASTGTPTFPTGLGGTTGRSLQDWILSANQVASTTSYTAPLLANGTAKYAVWIAPPVTNKALYDWDSINVLSPNYGFVDAKTYNVELQQELLSTPTSSLNLQVGWFRQEIKQTDNYGLGQSNQRVTLFADPNLVLSDGSANPFFGSPWLYDYDADTFGRPEINNNWRVLLAYEKNFTTNTGWTRWLGRHRISALWSRQEDNLWNLRYRLSTDGGDTRYLPNTATAGWSYWNSGLFDRRFYLGQNQNAVVQYSPGIFNLPGSGGIDRANIYTYNFLTHSYDTPETIFHSNYSTAGTTPLSQKVLEAQNIAWQAFLWKDRIVGTAGWRRDDFKSRQTNLTGTTTAQQYPPGGYADQTIINRMTDWGYVRGRTKTAGVVVRPLVWKTGYLGGHLNRSDNFNPPSSIQYDFRGVRLPKPQGKGKDYGIDLSLFDNRLVARINWFQSDNQNSNASSYSSTAAGRIARMDTTSMRGWAEWVVRYQSGESITAGQFGNNTAHPLTAAQISSTEALMQDSNYSYANNGWPTGWRNSTMSTSAKGLEAQVIYNPTTAWTMKLTVGKQKSTYSHIAPELLGFIPARLATWQAATATGVPAGEINVVTGNAGTTGTPTVLANFWRGYGFSADARLSNVTGTNPSWTTPEGFYNSAVISDLNVMAAQDGTVVPNERQWTWNGISTYEFRHGFLNGLKIGGGIRWADKALAGYLGDEVHLNASGQIAAPDLNRPIYVAAETHYDLWVSYSTKIPKLFGDKVRVRFQLNVRDLTENGGLRAIAYNYDGSATAFRIVDPRQYLFTTTLDF